MIEPVGQRKIIFFYKRIWETKRCRGSNKLGIASELNPGFSEKEQNEKE